MGPAARRGPIRSTPVSRNESVNGPLSRRLIGSSCRVPGLELRVHGIIDTELNDLAKATAHDKRSAAMMVDNLSR